MNAIQEGIREDTDRETRERPTSRGLAELVQRATRPEPPRPSVQRPSARNRSEAQAGPYDLD